jgi:hydrogenase nickel incorporation protein HypA/HybF
MHESSLCRALISQVEQIAVQHNATAVKVVEVGIGPLSGIHAEELRHAFPAATANTPVQDAELVVHERPLRLSCLDCGRESESRSVDYQCRWCCSDKVQLLSGDQIMIENVELTR